MMEEIGVLVLDRSATHRSANGFHEIEKEPFGHFSGRETRADQGSFRNLPSRSCVKIAVSNWAPDVLRMCDNSNQVVKKKDEKRRPSVVCFGGGAGDTRRTKARFVHQRSA